VENASSGVWTEYMWPRPGEKEGSRKLAYCLPCQRESSRGVFRGLRRQDDHRGSIKAERWEVAWDHSLASSRKKQPAAWSGRLFSASRRMIARERL